jgi:putative tricarboxylic transport membrane protein
LKLARDGWTGVAVFAASATLFALTLGLRDNPLVPIGPGFYPRIVLGITVVLAAALVAFSLLGRAEPQPGGGANYRLVLALFAIFFLYVGALPFVGFRLATFVFVAAAQSVLEPPRGLRGWAIVAATALITTLVTYVLFERYLQVLLPRGRWTGF